MILLGETKEGLLLSATRDEVAELIGYYGEYAAGVREKLKPGATILVHKMYQTLYKMSSLKSELDKASAELRVAADLLQLTNPLIEAINTAGSLPECDSNKT